MPVTAAAPESTTDQILLPSAFVEDPAGFLALVASQPTSRHGLAQLSGPVAAWFVALSAGSEQVANVYLQAAAVQLRDIGKVGDVEQEMQRAQQHYEVLEVRRQLCRFCGNSRCSGSTLSDFLLLFVVFLPEFSFGRPFVLLLPNVCLVEWPSLVQEFLQLLLIYQCPMLMSCTTRKWHFCNALC